MAAATAANGGYDPYTPDWEAARLRDGLGVLGAWPATPEGRQAAWRLVRRSCARAFTQGERRVRRQLKEWLWEPEG